MSPSHLAHRSTREVPPGLLLVVPVGSIEQHGPHLPLGTDSIIAMRLADELLKRVGPTAAAIAPAVSIGASGEHSRFAGTLSLGTDVLTNVFIELGRSATQPNGGDFGAVLFVNGHGGNSEALRNAGRILTGEGRRVFHWSPRVIGLTNDSHAGRIETSVMLYLAAHLVRMELAEVGNVSPLTDLGPQLRAAGVHAVSANGILGDPRGSTPERGHDLFTSWVDDLEAVARGLLHSG